MSRKVVLNLRIRFVCNSLISYFVLTTVHCNNHSVSILVSAPFLTALIRYTVMQLNVKGHYSVKAYL